MNTLLRADRTTVVHPAIQPGGGGSIPTSALQFVVRKIEHKTAKEFVEHWHYSKRIPTGKNLSFGAYSGTDLYAVIVFGIGVNPFQAKFLGVARVLEIKRMCRIEPPDASFPLSKFIAIASRMVRKEFPFDCLYAFADPEQGHEGTVYKASGFKLHGMTNPEWHVVGADGIQRHRRFAFRHARRHGITIGEARDLLSLKRVQTKPKYRWVRYCA